MTIAIVDVGMGNVGSVANMLSKLGVDAERTSDPTSVGRAKRIVLPGVGAFDVAMQRLAEGGLIDVLDRQVEAGVPLLGICLGMQLLATESEEGSAQGLNWIPGAVRRLHPGSDLPVPHMGWSTLHTVDDSLFGHLDDAARFYFVHSYALVPDDATTILASTEYGTEFVSVVRRGSVTGVQFHPEKSHRHGMALLRGWLNE